MPNQNMAIIAGHMTRDPEMRFIPNGSAVVGFSIAVNKEWTQDGEKKKAVVFIDCKAWRGTAEYIAETFKKGDGITITGELSTEQWTDKTTQQKRSKTLVTAHSAAPFSEGGKSNARPATQEAPVAQGADNSDDVPF